MGAFKYQKRYRQLHRENPKWFSGSLKDVSVKHITELVQKTGATSLLDFGCGKGYQYLKDRVHEAWGILPHCYDPGVRPLENKPDRKFNGVICTDVMEHIQADDVDEHFAEMASYIDPSAPGFLYFSICCRPAWKTFSDGLNVHLCVKPPRWWNIKLSRYAREGLIIKADYEVKDDESNYGEDESDDDQNSHDNQPERV